MHVVDGFKQRGEGMTRLETFTDAAFAFAVTMLVVGGGDAIPVNFAEMMVAMKQVPAFAASFANIMLFWYAHHVWSRRFGLDDWASALLSFILVFVVLIYVYPLKAIFSGALDFFSGGYLASYFVIDSIADLRTMFIIFSSAFAALSAVVVLLNRHALAQKAELALSALEEYETVSTIQHWIINMAVAVLSIVLAMTLPGPWTIVAGMIYGIFGVILPWHSIRRLRRRPD
ncbi:MAG: TMEM175 family protein [Woeseiaceae bacterium]